MLDFEKEDNEESRLEAYQRQIAERKQNKAFEVIPYSTRDFSNENEICAEQELSVEQLNLKFSVDDKIDSICLIDKEYQDTLKLVKESEKRAQKAKEAANKASNLSAGFGKKRKAIEALQNAQKENSLANEANSQAIYKIAELQQRLCDAIKALLSLNVRNLAASRSVYRQLELKLKGASEQELSDLAKEEIQKVMTELKKQQDMMLRQEKMSEEINKQNIKIQQQDEEIEKLKITTKKLQEKQNQQDLDNNETDNDKNGQNEEIKEKKRWFQKNK